MVSKNLLQFEVIQKFSLKLKKEFIAVQKDGNELKERGSFFLEVFLVLLENEKIECLVLFFYSDGFLGLLGRDFVM